MPGQNPPTKKPTEEPRSAPLRTIDTLLLLALPASGKSEVRRYLAQLSPAQCKDEMHLGQTVQLDDYPYVHMMRRISQELRQRGHDGVFFDSNDVPMKDPRDWGTLIVLLNQDFDDLVKRRRQQPASAAEWLLDRFDAARAEVGAPALLGALPAALRKELLAALLPEAADLLAQKNAGIPDSLEGKTVVIEFARGGKDGSSLPLDAPLGYRYSLSRLSPEILSRSSILYIWVSPEESRRKNHERTDPNDPGSILNHGVPIAVMLGDYGCDDMQWLEQQAEQAGHKDSVTVTAHGRTYVLPLARFDNREDKTTFVRADPKKWRQKDVDALHGGLKAALARLAQAK